MRNHPTARPGGPPTPAGLVHRERGASALAFALIFPLMLTLVLVGVQAGLYLHGRTLAILAAEDGARAAAGQQATLQVGLNRANEFLDEAGGANVIQDARVNGTRTDTHVTLTVSGSALSAIPFWSATITQSAVVPVERLTG